MIHIDFLSSIYPLSGAAVVDIGAGDGTYARELAHEGAHVTAIEIDEVKLDELRANGHPNMKAVLGRAEAMPLPDASQDLACMFFSLHHVPEEVQEAALREIMRVVKPGGRLHIVEPFPYGSMFDVVRMIEEETRVRRRSHALMQDLAQREGFQLLQHKDYVLTRVFDDFDALLTKTVYSDLKRSNALPDVREEMQQVFEQVAEMTPEGRVLHQPCAAYHFALNGAG